MVFEKYLEENATLINEELDLILSEFLNETKKTNIKLLPFALGLLNSTRGGKRIRGVLLKLGFEIASGSPNLRNDVLRVASALEILHTAFLIHDDIMDKSEERRGQPSLYKLLGIPQAINVGDIGLYLPIKLISEANFLGEVKIKAINFLSEMVINTGFGQILDVEEDKSEIEFIRLYKTAKYTVAGPLQMGAILAGMDPTSPEFRGIKEFGEKLGIAFQIQDDILDKEIADIETAKKEALKYTAEAKEMIDDITGNARFKIILKEMTEYMMGRNK
ncbi:hypothetical protein A3C59_01420 [Candidatus Daviesbacteria bacterium RIFCSPHIGHO2_02_FULL_36_13]|uniref:Polyprenyl synthetase n=1 Tax=Candidatus Daviesbacteria bacterium RIFCSPHIGHO2_02_FULL_36_13 TaxID=1797768 RepID=A0A1F5JVK9_9BACT|nr:MAG: hypothetical protein A3C59_01420 [Candidatus Daviesbacteria bacterium RIFCSPHIGHO2_02_FULL_36_13]